MELREGLLAEVAGKMEGTQAGGGGEEHPRWLGWHVQGGVWFPDFCQGKAKRNSSLKNSPLYFF